MASLVDRFYVSITSTGTGDITPGSAVSNAYYDATEAALVVGSTYTFLLTDTFTNGVPSDVELFKGVYDSSGDISRDTVIKSKIGGTAGTDKIDLSGDAQLAVVAETEEIAGYKLLSIVHYSSNNTFNKEDYPGCTAVYAKVWGAGGGGGGSSNTDGRCGGGGGGGGYCEEFIDAASLTTAETVTVGAAGTASTSTGSGGTGGTSSFGTTPFLTATGGSGGTDGNTGSNNASGGSGSGGDVNFDGQPGGGGGIHISGASMTDANGGSAVTFSQGGVAANNNNGSQGAGFGAGGGGGARGATTSRTGAAGTAGHVRVDVYGGTP